MGAPLSRAQHLCDNAAFRTPASSFVDLMANQLLPTKIEAYFYDFPRPHDAELVIAMGLDTGRPEAVTALLPLAGSKAKSEAVNHLIKHGDTDDLILPILNSIENPREKAARLARGVCQAATLNHRKELDILLGHPELHSNSVRLALYTTLKDKNEALARRLLEVMDVEKMHKYLLYRQDWVCLEYLAELIPESIATEWVRRHTRHFHPLRGRFLAQARAAMASELHPPMARRIRARS
jgi:hypothetical protein